MHEGVAYGMNMDMIMYISKNGGRVMYNYDVKYFLLTLWGFPTYRVLEGFTLVKGD